MCTHQIDVAYRVQSFEDQLMEFLLSILRLHVEDQIPLAALARESGIGTRTLQRWHQLYEKHGLAGLDDTARRDKGSRRTDPATVAAIERLALTRPRPSIATLHRLIVEECLRESRPAPSYATVREIVQALDPGARPHARPVDPRQPLGRLRGESCGPRQVTSTRTHREPRHGRRGHQHDEGGADEQGRACPGTAAGS